ncbi:MAG TPA: maleylpyruvate isomerase family mycothiol-dependent enzyme [Segeticoccus sp.]|uniref:maleylpyruvate isomerase family mycothiol-dependent enzyme n=1 Tax=Segeticoccus sp. TaxID=2706531 RepID=UPI002D806F9D|nr:maleylpyruvate isomerase family mycothiol-dependent enzyme [Segeticoccus sp.]HET8601802.1 maleylpyruvate isomerase family mycothiol-dependent enzyme [Segeticoccus sp.]
MVGGERARDSAALSNRLRWMREGTTTFLSALANRTDEQLAGATGLEGWTGKHLLAHVAANADALGNLVHWARTGEETPMYSSPAQRNQDIEDGAQRSVPELRSWVEDSAGTLAEALDELTDEQWHHHVRTAQGRDVDATEIPWMRAREVMVHAVDLGPVTFAELPEDFLTALADDIVGKRTAKAGPALEIATTDSTHRWTLPGTGEPTKVSGTLASVTAYLAGRPAPKLDDDPHVPELPAWL